MSTDGTVPMDRDGIGDCPGRLITVAGGFLEYRVAPGWMVEIVNIEVSNSHRREGKGREMIQQLIDLCKLLHMKSVYVVTRRTNRIAHDFYEGMGFTWVATLPNFYPGDDPDAVMFRRDV